MKFGGSLLAVASGTFKGFQDSVFLTFLKVHRLIVDYLRCDKIFVGRLHGSGCGQVGRLVLLDLDGHPLSHLGDSIAQLANLLAHLVNHLSHRQGLQQQFAVGDLGALLGGIVHYRWHALASRYKREVVLQDGRRDSALGFHNGNLFGDILQLAYVAIPRIVHHHTFGFVGEYDGRHPVFLGHIGRELAEQHRYVVLALTQRREVYANLIESVVEVFTETAVAHSFDDIDIRCRHHAHIDLLGRRAAHRDNLAVLKHTEQLDLHGQRQFANLVEEYSAAVGFFKVTFARTVGSREGTFHMAKKLAFDSAFGYGATVDRNESASLTHMLAQAVLVDDARKDILAHTAFAGDENGQVGRSHLDGLIEGQVEARVIAYDVVSLFNLLDIHSVFSIVVVMWCNDDITSLLQLMRDYRVLLNLHQELTFSLFRCRAQLLTQFVNHLRQSIALESIYTFSEVLQKIVFHLGNENTLLSPGVTEAIGVHHQ